MARLRAPTPGFVLLVRPRGDGDPAMRLGLTVSKKVGNAVVRNRMKRRFRELARKILPEAGHEGADHVLIGRQSGIERDFALLEAELAARAGQARADDRQDADPGRARVAIGPFAHPAAELPLFPKLLGLCNHGAFPLWRPARLLAGAAPSLSLPPLGGIGPRSGTMRGKR